MVTRQFNSADEFKTWLYSTLSVLADRQCACFNELSLDSYPDRFFACPILHEYAGGCWSACYHVVRSLREFVPTRMDSYYLPVQLCSFLGNSVRNSFGATVNITFGCLLVDILCGFLDDLEVCEKDGVVYVEY